MRLLDRFVLPDPRRARLTFLAVAVLCAGTTAVVARELSPEVEAPRRTEFAEPVEVAVPAASAGEAVEAELARIELLEIVAQSTRNMPQYDDGRRSDIVSARFAITAARDLPAPTHGIRLYLSGDGETARISPSTHDELSPSLTQLDLPAGQTVHGWLTFEIDPAIHFDTAVLVFALDPEGPPTAELELEWD